MKKKKKKKSDQAIARVQKYNTNAQQFKIHKATKPQILQRPSDHQSQQVIKNMGVAKQTLNHQTAIEQSSRFAGMGTGRANAPATHHSYKFPQTPTRKLQLDPQNNHDIDVKIKDRQVQAPLVTNMAESPINHHQAIKINQHSQLHSDRYRSKIATAGLAA